MKTILRALLRLVLLAVVVFLILVAVLVVRRNRACSVDWRSESYDAIIVLGAQVKEDGSLSVQLQWRLDTGFEAW